MKRFLGFVIKEFRHIFRDKRTMTILFGMPIVQLILFGYVVTNEIKNAKIAIYDKSRDEVTLRIIHKIISSGYFELNSYIEDDVQIEKSFRDGSTKEVIIFENDFAKKLEKEGTASVQIIADASDPNTANILVNYTTGIINDYFRKEVIQGDLPLQIISEVRMYYNESLKGVYMFVPGTMALILMLISAMMTSISIAKEKEIGTMEVLLVSPLKPVQIIVGKVIPYIVLSFINAITIILIGRFVFGMPVLGSYILLLSECMLFIILALSLGILISTVAKNQQVAMMLSMFALMLPTILLSGFIFPVENMPIILQWLSCIMPPRWFIIILKNIMLKGTGIEYIWKETLILIGMTTFFIIASIKRFKIRLE
ncbi:MAG: multidrug ABC transporter permease [Bacteroidetes bacterium GWA2_30_7]|nr:MAG: multidrug ABC transporter permease [Bacteroidetes bacterium GWA2_30_7]